MELENNDLQAGKCARACVTNRKWRQRGRMRGRESAASVNAYVYTKVNDKFLKFNYVIYTKKLLLEHREIFRSS